jgi:hypothetical protein
MRGVFGFASAQGDGERQIQSGSQQRRRYSFRMGEMCIENIEAALAVQAPDERRHLR